MVERTINKDVLDSINKFIEEIKKKYNVTAIILFGSYAKGTENENSDIDIAVVSDDFPEPEGDTYAQNQSPALPALLAGHSLPAHRHAGRPHSAHLRLLRPGGQSHFPAGLHHADAD